MRNDGEINHFYSEDSPDEYFQCQFPFPFVCDQVRYFEVLIKAFSIDDIVPTVAVGLAPLKQKQEQEQDQDQGNTGMVGWSERSIGIHSDDGWIYDADDTGSSMGMEFDVDDRMGVLWKGSEVYFVLNGQVLEHVFERGDVEDMATLVPTVTCKGYAEIEVLTTEKFMYKPQCNGNNIKDALIDEKYMRLKHELEIVNLKQEIEQLKRELPDPAEQCGVSERIQITNTDLDGQSFDALSQLEEITMRSLERIQQKKNDLVNNSFTCVICLDNRKDTLFLPCKHLCTCSKCSSMIESCPLCREYIEDAIQTNW